MTQFYLRRLRETDGRLHTYPNQTGSLTTDPHKLFPKQIREAGRQYRKHKPDYVPSTRGLMYATWELPPGDWSPADAAQWAEENEDLGEVYVILGPEGRWKATRMHTHPENPIVFNSWKGPTP